ncbi:alpha-L-fucosidase [Pedobacter sp. AW1-32]|uniref:alpha-L-fucosidase n=1 Tax=Pedobacter sp. AW1-32 TaxID=3383026 RepID=UPI003FED51C2
MKKLLLNLVLVALTTLNVIAQQKIGNETLVQKEQRMKWWTDDRFGMFIHWGLYAMPARHEWIKKRENISDEKYNQYFNYFNPDLFDPITWAKQAKAAGMKYAVLTAKHHEGFALFNSRYTDYKATNTPAKRDLVKEFLEAFRAQGIKVGLYYSLIDWHHPDYTIDKNHPLRPSADTDSAYAAVNKNRDMSKYRKYLFNQVTELLSNYGKIDMLWLDYSFPGKYGKGKDDWGSVELLKQIRKLQPNVIINNRLNLEMYEDGADFMTPEQVNTKALEAYKGKVWETCQTFSGSWGYYRDENTWKSDRTLLDLLITSVANGGNLLLNVGPTARGEFDYRAVNALNNMGKWMHVNSKSIYGCTFAPEKFKVNENTKLTYNPETKRLYVHLYSYPAETLTLQDYKDKVAYAQFLHDNSEIQFKANDAASNDLVLILPKQKPDIEIPVIELILK